MKGSGCYNCPVKGCTAAYSGSRCAHLRELAGVDFDPMTNADRIRAMSDEELAFALVKYEGTEKRPTPYGGHEHIFYGPNGETCGTRAYALQLWKGWLRQPAEESSS